MKHLAKCFFIGALLLGGCESGFNSAGIEGTGDQVSLASSYGTVSGFGSIYVNGVHFETDAADVRISGAQATEEALAVGMVVEVTGEIAADGKTGVAHTIRAEQVLLGVIEAVDEVDSSRKTVRILGQTVHINEDATFENTTFADLAPGLGASVSGFVTNGGYISATYLAQKTLDVTTDNVEVDGYVGAADPVTQTFQLKDLLVQMAGATFIDGDAEDIEPGVRVHVSGILLADTQTLQAERVTFASRSPQEERYTIIEGVVRDLKEDGGFMVQNVRVDAQNARIENGSKQDVQNAVQVIVFGPLVQGILNADRIHIKPRNPSRFRGTVSEINSVEGTFKLLDNLFKVTKFTQFKDSSRIMERYFNLERLRIGEEVEVFAVNVEGVWQVTRVTRRDQDIGPGGMGPGGTMGPPDRLLGKATMLDSGKQFFIDEIFVDATEVPEHEWMALRENQNQAADVAVDGFYIGNGQFRAIHLHVHPTLLCNPRDCGVGKLPGELRR